MRTAKLPINLNFDANLVTDFQKTCSQKGVTMTAKLSAFMASMVENEAQNETLSLESKLEKLSILSTYTQCKEIFSEVQDREHFDQLDESIRIILKALGDQWPRISDLEFSKSLKTQESVEVAAQ